MDCLEFRPRVFRDFTGDYRPTDSDGDRLSPLASIALVGGTSLALWALTAVLVIHFI